MHINELYIISYGGTASFMLQYLKMNLFAYLMQYISCTCHNTGIHLLGTVGTKQLEDSLPWWKVCCRHAAHPYLHPTEDGDDLEEVLLGIIGVHHVDQKCKVTDSCSCTRNNMVDPIDRGVAQYILDF